MVPHTQCDKSCASDELQQHMLYNLSLAQPVAYDFL